MTDPLHLLALQLQAKRCEMAARTTYAKSLLLPGESMPFFKAWRSAADAEQHVHREIRRCTRRVVIPMVRRAVAR